MHGYTAERTNIQTCETTEIHYKGTACVLRKSQERGFLWSSATGYTEECIIVKYGGKHNKFLSPTKQT